ncbi:MAG TPA: FHA domain-containing protein, partial [Candidatus Sumerlaeia bacterium]|nr:FHA domain-containing protein [Candidatus Sumerlaeia bacterium]
MEKQGRRNFAYLFPLEKSPALQEEYTISSNIITIGRHPNNSISIPQEAISRHHAKIEFLDGAFYIVDLNSSNGTMVNSQRITRHELKEGDIIMMGDVEFGFSWFSAAERASDKKEDSTVSLLPQ